MFPIDLKSRVPIYKQVYDNIKEMTLNGKLSSGDKLPSVRELSKELGVNPNTITKAFRELESDGIIYTVPGRGSYAAGITNDKFKTEALDNFRSSSDNCLRLGISPQTLCGIITESAANSTGGQNDNSE